MTRSSAWVVTSTAVVAALAAVSGVWWAGRGSSGPAPTTHAASPTAAATQSPPGKSLRGLPLRGRVVQGGTGLRLLVADVPAPFVLDVDRGSVERIQGLPTGPNRAVDLMPVGDDALIFTYRACGSCRLDRGVYLLRRGSDTATPLTRNWNVVPARDGTSLWMRSRRGHRCAVQKIGLDGHRRGGVRRMPCRASLVAELPAGLLLSYTGPEGIDVHDELLRPDGRVVRLRYQGAQPVVGNLVLTGADRRTPLLLHDVTRDAGSRLRWPSRARYALGTVTGRPAGSLATVDFSKYSPDRFDLWLLDLTTRRWQHLPSMPAHLIPKAAAVHWTPDGRVVILTQTEVAVWRPGESRLAIQRVKPTRQPGTEFILW